MIVTFSQLVYIMPGAGLPRISEHLAAINDACWSCEINTAVRAAPFLANCAHESGELKWMAEIWGPEQVPVQLTYDARMGNNKPEAIALAKAAGMSPGKYFRGYGPIQTTGFDNQCAVAKEFGIPLSRMVAWLQTPDGGWKSSAFYWKRHRLNEIADTENFDSVNNEFDSICDLINFGNRTVRVGDTNGFAHRLHFYERAKKVFGLTKAVA